MSNFNVIAPPVLIEDTLIGLETIWSSSRIVDFLEDPGDFESENHTVRLRRGSQGEMFSASLMDYEIVFTTDTNEVYVYNGTGKKLVGGCAVGTYMEKPSPVVPGKLYFETDTSVLFITLDGVWVQLTYSPAAISSHINAVSPHSKHATLNNSNLVVENPASATIVPTANSIPLSRSDSPTISGGWLMELDAGVLV
jgi:hypothetical protein